MAATKKSLPHTAFNAPGLDKVTCDKINGILQERLHALNDLHLTLKHIHWNVIGPAFIGVHEMLDVQVEAARLMTDETAERIATLGGEPVGTPGALVESRRWKDYSVGRADTQTHLRALDEVYTGLLEDHSQVVQELEELDPITQDMVIDHTKQLQQFHWFVRAHIEDKQGHVPTSE